MVNWPSRDLSGPGQAAAVQELFQAVFVAELLRPSKQFWITSGWISDVDILDNSARAFACLQPDWPAAKVRLSSIINTMVLRGGSVRILVREVEHNDVFLGRLSDIQRQFPSSIEWRTDPNFHAKGLVGDDFLLEGSMNLTRHGLTINDERITFRTDPQGIAQRKIELEEKWDNLAQC